MAEEQAVFNAKMIDNLKKLQAATEKLAAIVEEALRGSENGGSTAQHGNDIMQCLSA